ncbi:MAG: hypothetical protein JXA37_05765 [Chloroflexia bacterium]|nr:hypothetical protein [Chloroflexia bacterium]
MPVLLLPDRCDHNPSCFAAAACPNQALFYDEKQERVVVIPERCGDCRGPCLNFCDLYALRYAPTLEELRLLQAELDGTMSQEEIAQERLRLRKEAEDRQRQAITEVTEATFQKEVLQAQLPVLLEVWSPRAGQDLLVPLKELSRRYIGLLLIRRVNADNAPQLMNALQVRGVPTLFLFYQGQPLDAVMGMLSLAQLQTWVQQVLEQIEEAEASDQEQESLGPLGPSGRPLGKRG